MKATAVLVVLASMLTASCASCEANAKKEVQVVMGHADFVGGDGVWIDHVQGTKSEIMVGGEYEVRGHYKLASRNSALLALYSAADEPEDTPRTQGDTSTIARRGEGAFNFRVRIVGEGDLHLSLYPEEGGESFGMVYFRSKGRQFNYPSSN